MKQGKRLPGWGGLLIFTLLFPLVLLGQDAFPLGLPRAKPTDSLGPETVVVFNEGDRDSRDLAQYYAVRRQIPLDQLIGLKCSGTEEISRGEYETTIAEPLRAAFRKNGWWTLALGADGTERIQQNRIRYVAVIRGVPLKVAPVLEYAPDQQSGPQMLKGKNEASVDSELAVLAPAPGPISGAVPNPYYRSFSRIEDANFPEIMLVGRLDGPTAGIVHRMIDDSQKAEQEGLWGFCYVDIRGLRSGEYIVGDTALKKAAVDVQRTGIPVIMDAGEKLFPTSYPLRHASLYFGWYAENPAGPFAEPARIFQPGAVAFHIHSFSAQSVRTTDRFWVGPLLAHGAAAALGSVYEPFYGMLTAVDVFEDRLRRGHTLAESAYAGQPGLSWMNVCVGDPLYRPFRLINDVLETPATSEWTEYMDGARKWFSDGREAGEPLLRDSGNRLKSGVIFEGLALLQAAVRDLPGSYASLAKARRFYTSPDDAIRCYLHEINLLRFNGKPAESLALTHKAMKEFPNENATNLLRTIELELAPPPSPAGSSVPAHPATTPTQR